MFWWTYGIKSIIDHLGTEEFHELELIGPTRWFFIDHVLGDFSREDLQLDSFVSPLVDAIEFYLRDGLRLL